MKQEDDFFKIQDKQGIWQNLIQKTVVQFKNDDKLQKAVKNDFERVKESYELIHNFKNNIKNSIEQDKEFNSNSKENKKILMNIRDSIVLTGTNLVSDEKSLIGEINGKPVEFDLNDPDLSERIWEKMGKLPNIV